MWWWRWCETGGRGAAGVVGVPQAKKERQRDRERETDRRKDRDRQTDRDGQAHKVTDTERDRVRAINFLYLFSSSSSSASRFQKKQALRFAQTPTSSPHTFQTMPDSSYITKSLRFSTTPPFPQPVSPPLFLFSPHAVPRSDILW